MPDATYGCYIRTCQIRSGETSESTPGGLSMWRRTVRLRSGEALRQAREGAGLTMTQLAAGTGCSRATIWKLEQGDQAGLDVTKAIKLAGALEIHPDRLFVMPAGESASSDDAPRGRGAADGE